MGNLRSKAYNLLRWSERYTKTDMVYLASGGFWMNSGFIAINILGFVLSIVFARELSKETFGTYQFILSLGTIITAFTLTGMNNAVTQAVAKGREGVYKRAVLLQLRFGVIPFLVAVFLAAYYFWQGNLTLSLATLFIGVTIPIFSSFNTYHAIIAGRKDFRGGFRFSLLVNTIQYGTMIASIFFIKNPLLLISINFLTSTVLSLIVYKMTLSKYKPNAVPDEAALSYGKHLSLANVFVTATSRLDNLLIFHFLGAAELAIYFFATTIPEKIGGFFKTVPAMALPRFASQPTEQIRPTIIRKTLIFTTIAFVISGLYILIAPDFFRIFFPQYSDSVPYSQAIALVVALGTLSSLPAAAISASQSKRALYIYNTASPILAVIIMVALAIPYGIWGLIIARGVSHFLNFIILTVLLKNIRHEKA